MVLVIFYCQNFIRQAVNINYSLKMFTLGNMAKKHVILGRMLGIQYLILNCFFFDFSLFFPRAYKQNFREFLTNLECSGVPNLINLIWPIQINPSLTPSWPLSPTYYTPFYFILYFITIFIKNKSFFKKHTEQLYSKPIERFWIISLNSKLRNKTNIYFFFPKNVFVRSF